MNRKITRFAFGSKCGALGLSGLSFPLARSASIAARPANAVYPNPAAAVRKNPLRFGVKYSIESLLQTDAASSENGIPRC